MSLSKKVKETTNTIKFNHVLSVLNEENITLHTFSEFSVHWTWDNMRYIHPHGVGDRDVPST